MRLSRLTWLCLLCAAPAFAQSADPVVAPKTSNPGDDPAQLERETGLDAGEPAPAEAVKTEAVLPASDAGSVLVNEDVSGKISASARISYQRTSNFPGDELGTRIANNPFETRLRINPEVHFRGFGFVAEADTATGALVGTPPDTVVAARVPHPAFNALELRQLYAEYKWKTGVFRVGQQLSAWGLGILANGGSKDAEAGDFGQQHFGSLTYRAMLAGRPLFNLGGLFRAIEPVIAVDLVVRDGTAEIAKGDDAYQGVFALRFNADADRNFGIYAVYRHQRARQVTDNARATDVVVVDVAGKWTWSRGQHRAFSAGFEVAGITGTTTQGRNDNAPIYEVRQVGAAAKLAYRFRRAELKLDWGFASGDANPNDDKLENFRFDRDYKVGLVLFDEVLGWQSARSGKRASDPDLLGQAPEGVELAPTGGAITSAWYLFPRLKYGIREWIDVYGGPLFAFSTARLTDPFNTRVGGGTPVNYLGGRPGGYLGTELDLGAQARFHPIEMLTISLTLEAGMLFPGDGFRRPNGENLPPVGLARLRLAASL